MSWAVGWDPTWGRDIGYGVPAICDRPACHTAIDRGLAYVCGNDLYGGEHGCGLFFCYQHGAEARCERCEAGEQPFEPTADVPEWMSHKLNDPSWAPWRIENPDQVAELRQALDR